MSISITLSGDEAERYYNLRCKFNAISSDDKEIEENIETFVEQQSYIRELKEMRYIIRQALSWEHNTWLDGAGLMNELERAMEELKYRRKKIQDALDELENKT